jgi:hypothetical protein
MGAGNPHPGLNGFVSVGPMGCIFMDHGLYWAASLNLLRSAFNLAQHATQPSPPSRRTARMNSRNCMQFALIVPNNYDTQAINKGFV